MASFDNKKLFYRQSVRDYVTLANLALCEMERFYKYRHDGFLGTHQYCLTKFLRAKRCRKRCLANLAQSAYKLCQQYKGG